MAKSKSISKKHTNKKRSRSFKKHLKGGNETLNEYNPTLNESQVNEPDKQPVANHEEQPVANQLLQLNIPENSPIKDELVEFQNKFNQEISTNKYINPTIDDKPLTKYAMEVANNLINCFNNKNMSEICKTYSGAEFFDNKLVRLKRVDGKYEDFTYIFRSLTNGIERKISNINETQGTNGTPQKKADYYTQFENHTTSLPSRGGAKAIKKNKKSHKKQNKKMKKSVKNKRK